MSESLSPTPSSSDRIVLTVPLRSDYLSTVRTVAASLGADAGFSIDEIDDVRLGIGEVVAALVDSVGGSDARVTVAFTIDSGEVTIEIQVDGDDTILQLDELATGILRSVLDRFEVRAGGAELMKRAVEVAAGQVVDGSTVRA